MNLFRRKRKPAWAPAPSTEEILDRTDGLVADARFDEAIELLTAANRANADIRLELRLVDVRSEAALASEPAPVRPEWPDSVADLFPGELIPEVRHGDLTAEVLHSAMTHHGSLIVRGLISPERVDRLVAGIDASLAAFDATEQGAATPEHVRYYRRFERDRRSNRESKRANGSIMTVESPAMLFELMESFREAGIPELSEQYFGERPHLLARKGTLRRIAAGGNTGGWHQDGAFMGEGIRSLNVWIALTHCGDTAPGIDVVGRQLNRIVETGGGAFSAWATDPDAAERAAAGALVRPIFDAGDAILFDHLNLHRTAIDPSMTVDRYAIETWLLSPSTYGSMLIENEQGYSPRDQVPIAL
ncbi:MAG: hypothetical protein HKN26_07675 [Acidimicrobiales bacterium]|nr:hypothetical protein [Acidimicrobiales bacterium]